MFALPSDYVAAQDEGKTFAAEYYGRLNESAESAADMFAKHSRYYSMDSLNGRPAVGRAKIFREVRRFLGTYGAGRRSVHVVSVDAQIDGGDGGRGNGGGLRVSDYFELITVDGVPANDDGVPANDDGGRVNSDHSDRDHCSYDSSTSYGCTSYGSASYGSTGYGSTSYGSTGYGSTSYGSDKYGSDNEESEDGGSDGQGRHLAVFVRAEWTDSARPLSAPLQFIQTFRVRCLGDAECGYRYEIVITIVKTMAAAVQPPSQQQQLQPDRPRRTGADHKGSFNSGRGKNDNKTPIKRQFKQDTYADCKKHLNAEAREFELRSDAMSPPDLAEHSTDDDERLDMMNDPWWIHEQSLDYQDRVKAFLEGKRSKPTWDSSIPSSATDDGLQTNVLHVGRVDKSITADQLYAAFGRYGKVRWVRVLPGGRSYNSRLNSCVRPYHSARICFDLTESVESAIRDYRYGPGHTIGGHRVSFRKSRPDK